MDSNSSIFTLIKSLTKAEKRFFQIFSKRHTIGDTNNYLILFNIINQLKFDDNELIIKGLKENNISTTYLSADKNYLFSVILKSLTVFHNDDSYGMKLKNQLQSIEILFYKGLYKESLKLIQSAEKVAVKIENFSLLLDILNWKKKCLGYSKGLSAAASVRADILHCIKQIENLENILNLYYKSYALHINEDKVEKEKIIKEYRQLINNPLLKTDKAALSYTARIYFHLIYEHYFYAIDDNQKELESLEKITAIIQDFELYPKEHPLDYISIYNRILSLKKYIKTASFYDEINVLRKLTTGSAIRKDIIEQRVFILINSNELEFLLITHQYKKSLQKLNEIEKQIQSRSIEIEPFYIIHFYYLYALSLFNAGEYKKAVDYINTIINQYHYNDRPSVFIKTEILNILVHLELKNFELVSLLCRRIKKKYNKKELLSDIESDLIKVLATSGKQIFNKKKTITDLQKITEKYSSEHKKNVLQKNYLIENYLQWIEAYRNNTTALNHFEKHGTGTSKINFN